MVVANTFIKPPPERTNLDKVIANTPACLIARPQWVTWRFEPRGEIDEPTKVLYNPNTGRRAKSNDSTTWGTFDEAIAAARNDDRNFGVGYVFSSDDPYVGVDLDNAVDRDTREFKEWAAQIIEDAQTYVEMSPTFTGAKLIVEAKKPGPKCRKGYNDGEVEMYETDRFFTITGEIVPLFPNTVEPAQDFIDQLYEDVFKPSQETTAPLIEQAPSFDGPNVPVLITDDDLIGIISRNRKQGSKFDALMRGDTSGHDGNDSRADLALCNILAYWTRKDFGQMDRIFRGSGLMRPKWDSRRGESTYGAITINEAIASCKSVWPGKSSPSSNGHAKPGASKNARNTVVSDDDDDVPTHERPHKSEAKLVALGTRDPESERLVLSSKKTKPTAEAFVKEFHTMQGVRSLHTHSGMIQKRNDDGAYREYEDGAVRHELQSWLHDALQYKFNKSTQSMELVGFESNTATIKTAVDAIRDFTFLPSNFKPPFWYPHKQADPPPRECLVSKGGILHIPTGQKYPPSPRLFTPAAIDFEPDPNAPPPTKWLTFLNDIFDGDTEQIETLQEWAGYLLTPDTKYQKALFMVGPRRCGKGTITRLLTAMIGSANCASPTTMSFAAQFGLAGLVGKTAAFINDARFQGNNVPLIVERLLNITGEDAIEVERKFRDSVSIRLSTRFTISSNELPKFTDASNALIGRFIVLRFTKSFYDREDTTLEDKLRTELPGILNWSLEGWKRLNQRCKFVQPKAGRDAVRELEELSSPVTAFVREKCVLDPEKKIEMDRLYRCYEAWCVSTGMKHATTSSPVFSRNLTSAYPTITRGRPTIGDERIRFFKGIDTVDFFV